ncbi:hypothetical protein KSS87_014264 [Heliosperma pusillum]|nr:hypothetical protein KSS87_014264 [Heliosperma pusillum]
MAVARSSISIASSSSSLLSSSPRCLSNVIQSLHCSFSPNNNNFTLHKSLTLTSGFRVSALSMAPLTSQQLSHSSFLDTTNETGVLHFVKYHGLGNDFILVDNRDSTDPKITPEQAVKLCDRNFGIGADGVIFAMPGVNGTDFTMRIFNSDGSEPEMCGNGVRCFARFIAELQNLQGTHSFTIHTGAGLIIPEIQDDGQVKVDMGEPVLKAADVPTNLPSNKELSVVKADLVVDGKTWAVTCVSMGNPHCVTFGKKGEQGKEGAVYGRTDAKSLVWNLDSKEGRRIIGIHFPSSSANQNLSIKGKI